MLVLLYHSSPICCFLSILNTIFLSGEHFFWILKGPCNCSPCRHLSTLIVLEEFSQKDSGHLHPPSMAPHYISKSQFPGRAFLVLSDLATLTFPVFVPYPYCDSFKSQLWERHRHPPPPSCSRTFPLSRLFPLFLANACPVFLSKISQKYHFSHENHSAAFNFAHPIILFINSIHCEPTALSLYLHYSTYFLISI